MEGQMPKIMNEHVANQLMFSRMIRVEEVERWLRTVTDTEKQILGSIPYTCEELLAVKQTHVLIADFGDSIAKMLEHPHISDLSWHTLMAPYGPYMVVKEDPQWRLVPTIWMEEYDQEPIPGSLHSARAIVYACVLWRLNRLQHLLPGIVIPSSDGVAVGCPTKRLNPGDGSTDILMLAGPGCNYRRM